MTPLIKRLEALTGPSREVDAEIAKAIGWVKYITWTSPNGRIYADCPNFTNSLDAAMTLVPAGYENEMSDLYGIARVRVGMNYKDGPFFGECKAGSLPIAFCIAAMKAREVDSVQIPD